MYREASLDDFSPGVRDAYVVHQSFLDQLCHGLPRGLERDRLMRRVAPELAVEPVHLVEIDAVDSEAAERQFHRAPNSVAVYARTIWARCDLCKDQWRVGAAGERGGDKLLCGARAVDLRGVDPVDPGVERCMNRHRR